MESAVADALLGKILDQRYLVRSRIAHGGMATVYLATDTRLDREVALKVMHAELARDADFVDRFIGEAKSVARLSHPNIVAVFDQGSDGHHLYLAMEYVAGQTLRSLLASRGWFRYHEALRIMDPILAGLAAAHRTGIVHRDVKPENVLLTADGRVKVVDFGLARAQAATRQTRTGQIIGTVAYIAPEQVQGGTTDFRTDVYAAGVMLFELLTGRQPYSGESPLAVAYAHVNNDVPPPSAYVGGLPPALDYLVRAATSRDPRRRPPNAEEFMRAARAVSGGQGTTPTAFIIPNGTTATVPAPASSHTMVVQPGDFSGYETYGSPAGAFDGAHAEPLLQRWLFSKRLGAVVVGVVVALAFGFGGWWFAAGRYSPLPSVTGMTETRAVATLHADGFKTAEAGRPVIDDGVPKGDVISISPSGRAPRGATITLTISAGPKMITVPPVAGQSPAEAKALLRKAGLRVALGTKKVGSATLAVGTVAGTTPPAGTSWPENRLVYVEVAEGIPMPPLKGQNIGDVQSWAGQNNIQLNVQQTNDSAASGTIIAQSVPAGTPVSPGQTVTVTVSQGPAQVPIPNVAGQPFQQAQQELQQAGFVVNGQQFGPGQTVVATSPSGQAPQGSTITVYYGL